MIGERFLFRKNILSNLNITNFKYSNPAVFLSKWTDIVQIINTENISFVCFISWLWYLEFYFFYFQFEEDFFQRRDILIFYSWNLIPSVLSPEKLEVTSW